MEVAISCVIPACLNTNIQTAQLQHKPGKRGAEEALHCVPSRCRCRADGKRLGPCAPGARQAPLAPGAHRMRGSASSSRLPSLLDHGKLNEKRLLCKEQKGLAMLFPKCLHQSWSGLRQSRMRRSQLFCITDFPTVHCTWSLWPARHP